MKRILTLLLFITIVSSASAQGFKRAAGIRGGYSTGIQYRIYTNDLNSYRMLLSITDDGARMNVLKEFHKYDLFDFAYQIVFYYGLGIHGGYESWDVAEEQNNMRRVETRSSVIVGLDGLAGFEYIFDRAPVSVGLEVKPYFDLLGKETFDLKIFDVGFTISYLF